MNTIKVKDNTDLVRSVETNAILNVNKVELEKHRARRKLLDDKDSKLESLTNKVESLEILVQSLLNNYNKDRLR